jgi:hypothetical protein
VPDHLRVRLGLLGRQRPPDSDITDSDLMAGRLLGGNRDGDPGPGLRLLRASSDRDSEGIVQRSAVNSDLHGSRVMSECFPSHIRVLD